MTAIKIKFMKIIAFIFIVTISFTNLVANAQSKSDFTRIGIGDKVPADLPLVNLVNYSKPNATVADFRGKWLILDYWFTGCAPCIQSWPKQMQLQKKYGDKIQIMGVNHMQSKDVVESFITRRNSKSEEPFLIPSVTGDAVLHKILPPSGYPSIVWIDPDGIYRAFTTGSELNDENIKAVIENNKSLKTINVNKSKMNLRTPLFIDGNGGSGQQMLWYSTVSGYSEKVADGYYLMSADSSGYAIADTHKPILYLIMIAYGSGPFYYNPNVLADFIRLPKTRIELRVKDPARLQSHTAAGVRLTNNLYTYQLISYKPRTIQQLKDIMKDDIQKYFELEMNWTTINKECLVLTAKDTILLGDNKLSGNPKYLFKKESDIMYLKDVPISNLFGYMIEYFGGVDGSYNDFHGYPLIDETGYKGGLDIILEDVTGDNYNEVLNDYRKLNKALEKYRIQFKLEKRDVDVLVISDAGSRENN